MWKCAPRQGVAPNQPRTRRNAFQGLQAPNSPTTRPARLKHARHLGDGSRAIGDKAKQRRRDNHVKPVIRERELFGVRYQELHRGIFRGGARSRHRDHVRIGVHPSDCGAEPREPDC